MLTIFGSRSRFCDGVSRRNFLKIGALGLGGLTLPQLFAAEARAGVTAGKSHKAVIMIFLPGGPAHQDIFDMKPDAPAEVRGEFKPIRTNVSGIEICEHLPRLAGMMDRMALIRSIVGATGGHDAIQCLTGRTHRNMPPGGWPCMGSVVSKVQGALNPYIPPSVIGGQALELLLQRFEIEATGERNFDEFPIPYRAVAANLGTGEPVVIKSGSLSTALRASMSVPAVFPPVEIDGMPLCDGGVTANFPIRIAKDLGADVIIGVDISSPMLARLREKAPRPNPFLALGEGFPHV